MPDPTTTRRMPGTRFWVLFILLALAFSWVAALGLTGASGRRVLAWLKGQQKGGSAFDLWKGRPAPELDILLWDGTVQPLGALRGQRVILLFWASWSPLSRGNLELLQRWGQGRDRVAMLAVAAEDPQAARAFAGPLNLTLGLGAIAPEPPPPFDQIVALPTTFFLDETGLVVHVEGGPLTPELLDRYAGP